LNVSQDRAHLNSRLLAAFREIAHLLGDDRETSAMLACERRFNGGVESEQIRLIGKLGYGAGDGADRLRLTGERQNGLRNSLGASMSCQAAVRRPARC